MSTQYIRRCTLAVGDNAGNALDLSELHLRFQVQAATAQTPRRLEVRIYNLALDTARAIQQEFTQVALSAGYQSGAFGLIFYGLVAQIRRGKENATDTYLEISAADSDTQYNQSAVNTTLAAGWTPGDVQKALVTSMDGASVGYSPTLSKTAAPRGKVLYGATRDHLRAFSEANGLDWHLDQGLVNFVPQLGYIPGEAIVLNAQSGLIGVPEQTIDGVNARCLLNPNLRTGRLVQIDQRSIQTTTLTQALTANDLPLPNLDRDGRYKVYSLRHTGDTRGQSWYTDIICAAINPSGAGIVPNSAPYISAVVNGQE